MQYYGRNDRSTLEGIREEIIRQRQKAEARRDRYSERQRQFLSEQGAVGALNTLLCAVEDALDSGSTPKGIVEIMEREAAAKR